MGDSSTKSKLIKGGLVFLAMVAVAIVAVLITIATVSKGDPEGPRKAVAVINIGTNGVSGKLELKQDDSTGPVIITGQITGLPPNSKHGFHVHGSGDVRNGCASTGSHFNPHNKTHGAPTDEIRHVGDLGNIDADGSGIAQVNIMDKVISLSGINSVIGRAFVVHSGVDDLGKGGNDESLKTGNAGSRVGCGIIGVL